MENRFKGVAMNRRHYQLFATYIANAARDRQGFSPASRSEIKLLYYFADELSSILKQDNSRFDQDRFLTACGLSLESPDGEVIISEWNRIPLKKKEF